MVKNLFEIICFMKNNVELTDKKEIYVAPVCECIEVDMEGVLCSSAFETAGDDFWGEW